MKPIFCITNILKLLSRGGLKVPSPSLANFNCDCFAISNFAETKLEKKLLLQEKHEYFP